MLKQQAVLYAERNCVACAEASNVVADVTVVEVNPLSFATRRRRRPRHLRRHHHLCS